MKTPSITLLCAVLLIMAGAKVSAQKTDFSGNWKIDKEKSDFGRSGPMAAIQELHVIDKKDSITIEGGMTKKSLAYNGKVLVTGWEDKYRRSKTTMKESVKRSADGKSIIITTEQIDDNPVAIMKSQNIQTWSLSADQKELTIKWTLSVQIPKNSGKPDMMTFVYTRQ